MMLILLIIYEKSDCRINGILYGKGGFVHKKRSECGFTAQAGGKGTSRG